MQTTLSKLVGKASDEKPLLVKFTQNGAEEQFVKIERARIRGRTVLAWRVMGSYGVFDGSAKVEVLG